MGSRLPLPAWFGETAVALVVSLIVGAGSASSGECPASVVWFFQHGNGGYSTVDSFIYDMNFSPTGYDSARVSFDRNEARLSVSAVGALWAGARVIERFDVIGVPQGTPVDATLVFRLDGESLQWCGGGARRPGCAATASPDCHPECAQSPVRGRT